MAAKTRVRNLFIKQRPLKQLCWDLIQISRFDKYNSFLALFAGVWSTLLAGSVRLREDPENTSVWFVLSRVFFCSFAAYIFSGAGMVWNDWVDRDIDAKVARTKDRPLASGRLRTPEAMIWMLLQAAVSTAFLYWMMEGRHVLKSMVPPTIGTLIYPYCKRPVARKFGLYPQYVLGLTAACPVVFGRASIYNEQESFRALVGECLPLCLLVFVWTLYFNTAYSYQDIQDDLKLKVNSSYVFAGRHIHAFLIFLAGLLLATIPWVLYHLSSPWLWISWMGVWSVSSVDQMLKFDAKDPSTGKYVFQSNVALGLWMIAACFVEVLLRV